MLHTSPWSRFELTTSVAIGTDCIGSCKSNRQTITETTAPHWTRSRVKCLIWLFGLILKSLNSKKVSNSTNINRTNTYWTEPTEHKKTTTYDVGNPHPRLGSGTNQESDQSSIQYLCVLGVSSVPLSKIFLLDGGTVLMVWHFFLAWNRTEKIIGPVWANWNVFMAL
jgi:hypothetical protein